MSVVLLWSHVTGVRCIKDISFIDGGCFDVYHYTSSTLLCVVHDVYSLHFTSLCLQYTPTIVACVCIHLACKWSSFEVFVTST